MPSPGRARASSTVGAARRFEITTHPETFTMTIIYFHKFHEPKTDERDDFEPGGTPLDPDEGPETFPLQDDPDFDTDIDHGPDQLPGQRVRHSLEMDGWP